MKYGRYRIIEELGRGAMGVVFKAHDPQIDRMVALKVLHADKVESGEFIRRFLKEAKAIGRLAHPNIVMVYDAGGDRGSVYIAEEFVEGESLQELLKGGALPHCEVIRLGIQMAGAVDYAFQRGIVHRDLKPANMIVQADGTLKIMDFGIAHMEDAQGVEQTQAGMILGTPAYMSPEQVLGHPVDGRTDIFAIGVILYEMLVGKKPFTGANLTSVLHAITRDVPEAPACTGVGTSASLARRLAAIVMQCLEKDPDKRFQTGGGLAEALSACLGGERSERQHRFNPTPALVALLAAGVVLAGVVGVVPWVKKALQSGPPVVFEAQAVLNVESEPVGARIFLNGELKGRTPMALKLPLGRYEVQLSLEDYYEWTGPVNLDKKGEVRVFAELTPLMF